MRILGIDPGYGMTGFGLIEGERGQFKLLNCGAITTPANTDFSWRLEVIYNDMVELLKIALSHLPNVEVECYSGLLADYAREKGAAWLVKGIRNSRDFESELEMYQVNRHLGDLETVFLPARPEHLLCSSTVVRELLRYEQSTEHYLPSAVAAAAKEFLK